LLFETSHLNVRVKFEEKNDTIYQDILIYNKTNDYILISFNDYNSLNVNCDLKDTCIIHSYLGVMRPLMNYPNPESKITFLKSIQPLGIKHLLLKTKICTDKKETVLLKFHIDYVSNKKEEIYRADKYLKECVVLSSFFPIYIH